MHLISKVFRKYNWLFLLGIVFCLVALALLYFYYKQQNMTMQVLFLNYYLLLGTCMVIVMIILFRGLFLSKSSQLSMIVTFTSTIVVVYLAEIALFFFSPSGPVDHRESFSDTRSKLEVVLDERKKDPNVYSQVMPYALLANQGLPVGDENLFPLSGIPDVKTVFCNESGEYVYYQADRYGFRNPDSAYDASQIDLAIIGDSFAQSYCVQEEATIRYNLAQSGRNIIDFSMAGNDPLLELGTLKEYATHFSPSTVLWVYCEANDLLVLNLTQKLPIRSYVDDSQWSQGLFSKGQQLGSAMREYANTRMGLETKKEKIRFNFVRILTLRSIDKRVQQLFLPNLEETELSTLPLFKEVIDEANQHVQSWNGKMVFVYLPSYQRYEPKQNFQRQKVLNIVSDLQIPLIDFTLVTDELENPFDIFALDQSSHYNEGGYKMLSDYILQSLPQISKTNQ